MLVHELAPSRRCLGAAYLISTLVTTLTATRGPEPPLNGRLSGNTRNKGASHHHRARSLQI
jgi:hypothetical protein